MARYQVTVSNTGPQATSYGPLLDRPEFDPNLQVLGATWTVAASAGTTPAPGTASGGGPFTLAPASTALARRSTHTFTVDVRFRYRTHTAAAACAGPGTGLHNTVELPGGQETGGAGDNDACRAAPQPPTRALLLDKETAGPSPITDTNANNRLDAGDTIRYRFTLTNQSQITLTDLTVTDPKVTGLVCQATTLIPGASTTCEADHVITQAEVDAGAVDNTATAAGTDPIGGRVTSNTDSTSTPLTGTNGLSLAKTHTPVHDANGSGRIDAGDTVTWSFTVTNTGTRTVTNVEVRDPMFPGVIACSPATLAPGSSVTCQTRTLTLTQAHLDAGSIVNEATPHGTVGGEPVPSDPVTDRVALPGIPSLRLDKQVDTITDVDNSGTHGTGDTVTWRFSLQNTGTVTLDVDVTDPLLGEVTCQATTLAPGETTTCTAPAHTVTGTETASGTLTNTATATGVPTGSPAGTPTVTSTDDTATPLTASEPELRILKRAGTPVDVNASGLTDAGDTIVYTFTVTNTGNVPMRGVTVNDPKLGSLPAACGPHDLAPGADFTCSATYTVTAADEAAGKAVNSATATGTPPGAPGTTPDPVDSPPSSTTTPTTAPAPALTILKEAGTPNDVNESGITDAGDTIAYTFTITNTGNVPMNAVGVTDPLLGTLPVACGPQALAPGGSFTCSATYTVTAADEAAGKVVNTATATGTPPGVPGTTPEPVDSPPSTTTTEVTPPGPSLSIKKTASTPVDANETGITDAGDTVVFTFVVSNTGNVPLRQVTVNDPMLATGDDQPVAVTCPPGPLAPGASRTCTSEPWTITLAQEQAGVLSNTATATGIPPSARPGDSPVTSDPDTSTTPVTAQDPALEVVKTAGTPVDVNGSGNSDAGDTIVYTFTVTNTGNVPLAGVEINDPKLAAAGVDISCPATGLSSRLQPGEKLTCTSAPYTVTAADEANEQVRNTATAEATPPRGPVVDSPPSTTITTVVVPDPRLVIDKQASTPTDVNDSGITDAGDTIGYTFTVTNTGNVPLKNITVIDPTLAQQSAPAIEITCAATTLAPMASTTCVTNHPWTVTAADVASGAASNTAHATAQDPDDGPLASPPDTTSVPTTRPLAALVLAKAAGTPVDVNDSGITDAGDTIAYTFTVTNTGNVPVKDINVDDPKLAAAGLTITCQNTTLAPGASTTCTASGPYTVTAADVRDGAVANVARATGTDPDNGPVRSPESSTTTTTTQPRPSLVLAKSVDTVEDRNSSGLTDAGDRITWTFTVTNSGNVPVADVAVLDPMLTDAGIAVTCPAGPLDPGEQRTCTAAPYTVTAADEAAGQVVNSATVTGQDPDDEPVTSPPATTTTGVTTPAPALDVEKTAGPYRDVNGSGIPDAGDTIAYTFTITNVGNVPVTGVGIDDPRLADAGLAITCAPATLAVGAVATCTTSAPYVITEADEEAGDVLNAARATGTDPDGDPVRSPEDSTSTPTTTPAAGLAVLKEAGAWTDSNNSGLRDAGDRLAWTFTVTNTGNVPVHGVSVSDPLLDPAPVCAATTLAPGASTTCTTNATHTITEADEAAGSVVNTATAGGTDPDGDPVTSPPDQVTIPTTTPAPALHIDKTVDEATGVHGWEDLDGSGLVDTGDRITYSFTVANTGNVPVTAAIDDPRIANLPAACGPRELAPGETFTCTASLLVKATDVASGSVANTATATGTDPDGEPVTSPPDTHTVPTTTPQPALKIEKDVTDVTDTNGSGLTDAGDTITYEFTVTNTGNVPIRDVEVRDPLLGGVVCTVALLAPGAHTTCVDSYRVTAADAAAGTVHNTAFATGTPPGTGTPPVSSPPDSTSTPTTLPEPSLELEKRAAEPIDVNDSGITDAGDVIVYFFTLTNTGNVPLTNPRVDDPMLSAQGISVVCPSAPLAPQDSIICTVSGGVSATDGGYQVTAADLTEGSVTNRATGAGTDPDGHVVDSPPAVTSTPVTTPAPALVLDKTVLDRLDVNASGITDAGDLIKYGFTVTNTGNVPITAPTITDAMLAGAAVPVAVTCPAGRLEPGEQVTCVVSGGVSGGSPSSDGWYRVTAADQSTGAVQNTATVRGSDPDQGSVTSPPDTTSVPVIVPEPKLVLAKAVGAITAADGTPLPEDGSGNTRAPIPGDRLTWQFTVTNAGNVPIADVRVNDPLVAGGQLTCGASPLGPGQSVTCTASTGITQAQIDAGRVRNTATATGTDPDLGTVTSPPDTATAPLTQTVQIDLTKEVSHVEDLNGSGLTDEGDLAHWTFQLTNTGNVNLTDVQLTDALLASQNPAVQISCLWPGAADELPAGTSIPCTSVGGSVITAADVAAGQQTNVATVSAQPPTGARVEDDADASVPTTRPQPRVSLTKTAGDWHDVNASGLKDAGDTLAYSFTLTNAGNVPVTAVRVDDPKLAAQNVEIECVATTLAPGETTQCRATSAYTITAADVADGSVLNVATAAGSPPGVGTVPPTGTVTSPPTTNTTPTTRPQPKLTLRKNRGPVVDVNASGLTDAGDTVTYAFQIVNAGNVPLRGVTVVDPKLGVVGGTCQAFDLRPGEVKICLSRPYTITADDVEATAAVNVATVQGTDPDDQPVTSPPSTATVPTTTPQPGLVIDKTVVDVTDTNASGITDAGDVIAWRFTVSNTGNVPMRDVQVFDPLLVNGAPVCSLGRLAVGQTLSCGPFTHVVTEADERAGAVQNSATARGTTPDGDRFDSPPDTTSTTVTTPEPKLTVEKAAGTPFDTNDSGLTDAGDTMAWTFTVTNSGNVPLTDIRIDDPKLMAAGVAISCGVTALAPGAQTTCTSASYRITADDVDAGAVLNTATVRGSDPDGDPITSPPDDTSTTTTRPAPALIIDKVTNTPVDVNRSGLVDAGDTVTWTFKVTNSGNVPIQGVRIDDPLLAAAGITPVCDDVRLAPGAETTCTSAPFTITAAHVATGALGNTAVAAGIDPDGGDVTSPPDSTSVPLTQPRPDSRVVKSVTRVVDVNDSGITDAPDEIWYAFAVTNTGNVPLADVRIDDPLLDGIAIVCDPAALDTDGRLAVGAEVRCEASAPYVVSVDDERSDAVTNRAVAASTDPDGHPVTSPPDTESVPTTRPFAGLAVEKHAEDATDVNASGITDAGDTIAYTFTVTNTGNVPIATVVINDPMLERAGVGVDCPPGRLAVGASITCRAVAAYVVTEADEQAGRVLNTATARGTDPDGDPVLSPPDSTTTPVTLPQPSLSLVKTAQAHDTNASGNLDRGDTVDYTFTVTNTGNVPIRSVSIDDPMLADAQIDVVCPTGPLGVGATITCTAPGYQVTAGDAAAGAVANRATALGVDPDNGPVTSPPDRVSVPLTAPDAKVAIEKTAGTPVDVDGDGRVSPGDTVDFSFTVTNTGNVTVHDVKVSDPMLADAGITVDCPSAPLLAGATMVCAASAPWTITQAQVDAGEVSNTATVTGSDPWDDPLRPGEDTEKVPVPRVVELGLDKQAGTPTDTNGNGRTDAGDTVVYTFTVTNTGTSTISQIVVNDPLLSAAGEAVTCPVATLAADESTTCTAEHRITVAEMDAGSVVNTATVGGTTPGGDPVTSEPDTTTTPLVGTGGLSLVKKAELKDRDRDGYADIGERVRYTFTVTNTGSTTAQRITVLDPMLAAVGITATCPATSLAPGESTTCTAEYTVRPADTATSVLRNVATAQGVTPTGEVLGSSESEAELPLDPEQVRGDAEEKPSGNPDGGGLPDAGGPALGWLAGGLGLVLLGFGLIRRQRRPRPDAER